MDVASRGRKRRSTAVRVRQMRWPTRTTPISTSAGVFDRLKRARAASERMQATPRDAGSRARVTTARRCSALAASADPLSRAIASSFFPGRSGNLIIIPKPNWIFGTDDKAIIPGNSTTHGSGYPYDTDVPLILFGAGISPGDTTRRRSPRRHRAHAREVGRRGAAVGDGPIPGRGPQEMTARQAVCARAAAAALAATTGAMSSARRCAPRGADGGR